MVQRQQKKKFYNLHFNDTGTLTYTQDIFHLTNFTNYFICGIEKIWIMNLKVVVVVKPVK